MRQLITNKTYSVKRERARQPFTFYFLLFTLRPLCLLIIILLVFCGAGCERKFKQTKFLMSTIVEITAVSRRDPQRNVESAFDEIKKVESLMNVYNEDSEISHINRAAGKSAVEVSPDTLEVIKRAIKFSELTGGAFDVTVGPLMDLWGFGENGPNRVPLDDELKVKLSLVDYKRIVIDERRSTVELASPGMGINVGAIAKGYAVDRAIQTLEESGIQSALVNAGGDIYAMGSPPRKDEWRIGIRHPRRSGDLLGILKLKDKAVATSGDYENFFEMDGKRYCHIMDPKIGRPVEGIMSVTIIADNATDADALATAVFPLGAENGMKLIESLEGVDGIIVIGKEENDIKILLSSGMNKYMLPLEKGVGGIFVSEMR